MGIVYDARHALKVILSDPHADEEKLARLVRRFRQEAVAVAAVKHPNVVNITDSGVTSGAMPFLVMEFVEDVSLEKMLEGGKAFAPARALDFNPFKRPSADMRDSP
jgi:serine/threonine-protein kinase